MNSHSLFEGVYAKQIASALNTHDTDSITAGANVFFDMGTWKHASWLVTLAAVNGDTITRIRVMQATDAAGTSAKAVTGFTFSPTTLNVAGESATLEFDAANLDIAGGFGFIALEVSSGGGTSSTVSIVQILTQPRYSYGSRSGSTVRLPQDLAAAS
jgi:hypothetical protein